MRNGEMSRRKFLAGTVMGAALAAASGAAEKKKRGAAKAPASGARKGPRLAFIGVGSRGSSILQSALGMGGATVVAVADTYEVYRNRALGWCREKYSETKGYARFEDLLEKERLDACVIAAPDHIHAPAALAALSRGLDVYCEKPMTLDLATARQVRDAVRAKKAVFQVGTQLRSMPMYQKARETVQSGALGKLVLVQVNRHFQGGFAGPREVPAEASETTVDWPAFLRDTRPFPWTPDRYFRWRHYLEYSNGYFGDLMLHHLDICHFITGAGMPAKVQATGGIYHFEDGRTTPDTLSALIEYPEKFHLNFTCTAANEHYGLVERYLFTGGTIEINDMGAMTIFREKFEEKVPSAGILNEPHLQDFYRAIKSRGATIAPVEAGFQGAVCAHMAMRSCLEGKTMHWDPANEAINV